MEEFASVYPTRQLQNSFLYGVGLVSLLKDTLSGWMLVKQD